MINKQSPMTICLKDGNVYLSSEVYNTYFKSIHAVALMRRNTVIVMAPIQASGGGMLLKIINSQGDRMVHAHEFLTEQGIDLKQEYSVPVRWDSQLAMLAFDIP